MEGQLDESQHLLEDDNQQPQTSSAVATSQIEPQIMGEGEIRKHQDVDDDGEGLDVVEPLPSKDGEQPETSKPNKKGLKLTLKVDAAAKHNMQRHQWQQQQDLLTPSSKGTPKPMNVAVFLKEGEGHLLLLERGKITTAGEIKMMMMEILSIPKTSSHVFALWFISPYLEIQLKDHHIPFLLRKQWSELLEEFSFCKDEDDRSSDEPVLVFQRNSFLSLADEEKQSHKLVIQRLFQEAKHNILTTRYPIPIPDAEILAGMIARVKLGPYNAEVHKAGFFKKTLSEYLPYYAIGSNKFLQLLRQSSSEQHLLQQYERATNKSHDSLSCQLEFLKYCRSLSFYGCAFFKGSAIQDGIEMKPWKSCEKDVIVGINRLGITLFNGSKEEVLIHLPYDDLSWEFIRSKDVGNKEEEQSKGEDIFCIEYDTIHDGEQNSEQIQILSNQACMMDAMVTSCINFMNVMKIPKTPTSADYKKILDISYSTMPSSKKHNFSLTRPFKR
uniref:FERM domain-containing protein 8 n=1 Tax=Clytia hemisphaerica TaxID=252671 RepID=A0A7M5WSF1_9CNID